MLQFENPHNCSFKMINSSTFQMFYSLNSILALLCYVIHQHKQIVHKVHSIRIYILFVHTLSAPFYDIDSLILLPAVESVELYRQKSNGISSFDYKLYISFRFKNSMLEYIRRIMLVSFINVILGPKIKRKQPVIIIYGLGLARLGSVDLFFAKGGQFSGLFIDDARE